MSEITPSGTGLHGLDRHCSEGHQLLHEDEPVEAHQAFERWVASVGRWLNEVVPDTGLTAEWFTLGESPLVRGGCYYDDNLTFTSFTGVVRRRLAWLGDFPVKKSLRQMATRSQTQADVVTRGHIEIYIDVVRISELKAIQDIRFDLRKLVRICEELNLSFAAGCHLSVAMLARSLIDHVPPVFGCRSFAEVANNYAGSRSFKDSMKHLEESSRKIADQHLHGQIRNAESLPTARQVDCRADLDVLLGEIARLLRITASSGTGEDKSARRREVLTELAAYDQKIGI